MRAQVRCPWRPMQWCEPARAREEQGKGVERARRGRGRCCPLKATRGRAWLEGVRAAGGRGSRSALPAACVSARQPAGGWGPPVSVLGKRKMEEMGKLFWPLLENAQFGHLNGQIWKSDN